MTHNHKCLGQRVSFKHSKSADGSSVRVAGNVPAKLQNSPKIITTPVNMESMEKEDTTHKSCQSTIIPVNVVVVDISDRGKTEWVTYGFQVGDPLTRCVPGLRAQQTPLLEDEAGPDEDAANYCENDANDLESDMASFKVDGG